MIRSKPNELFGCSFFDCSNREGKALMTFLNRIRQFRVYRKLVLSYLIVIVLSISIVSIILYTLFSNRAMKEIDNSSKQMLSQVSYTANVVYKQIQDVSGQLLMDNDIISFLYVEEVNKIFDQKAYLFISKIQNVYPFLADISLYNFANGEYVDTLGLPRDPTAAAAAQRKFQDFHPRKAEKDPASGQLHLLTFRIVPEWQPITNTPKSAIVLDLNESSIQNTIRAINASTKNADTFVMDASGTILSHSDSAYFMENFSRKDYVKRILNGGESMGSFVQTLDHKKQLITFVRSSALDWYFVTVRPYDVLLSDIYTLRNWTLLVALLLVLIGAAIAMFWTGNLYNPIRALVDRVTEIRGAEAERGGLLHEDEYRLLNDAFASTIQSTKMLESNLHRSKQILKNSSMLSLLNGIDKTTLSQLEKEWGSRLKGPYFTVILFKIDMYRVFKEKYSSIDRELIRFAIGNIAQELLGKGFANDTAVTEEEIIVLLQSPQRERNDALDLTLSEIQDNVQLYYTVTVSVSIGDWCDSVSELPHSYRTAQSYSAYRMFYGHNCIINGSMISEIDNGLRYPSSRERKLIESIKLCSDKNIRADLDDWIAYLSKCTYPQVMQYTSFLLLAVIREFETIAEWWEVDTEKLYASLQLVQQAETLQELHAVLSEFCRQIVKIIEENKQNVSEMKNAKLVEDVKRLIQEKYADPGFSLDYAADRVGLSAGYLGKLFKSHANLTFNDYVTTVRMEKAKRLLGTTSATVGEIGIKVGILEGSYFSTLFKKHVGMTPSQFRESQANH